MFFGFLFQGLGENEGCHKIRKYELFEMPNLLSSKSQLVHILSKSLLDFKVQVMLIVFAMYAIFKLVLYR